MTNGSDTALGAAVVLGAAIFLAGSLVTSLCYGLVALALYIM